MTAVTLPQVEFLVNLLYTHFYPFGEELQEQTVMIGVGVVTDEAQFLRIRPLPSLYGIISYQKGKVEYLMNRIRGFVNLNRFKSGRTIKRLSKAVYNKRKNSGKKTKD